MHSQKALKKALNRLLKQHDPIASLDQDPLQIPHRYKDARDQEIAAVFSAQIAYGRVSLFLPVLNKLTAIWDRKGGPSAWVDALKASDLPSLSEITYRWNKPRDFLLLGLTLQETHKDYSRLSYLFESQYRRSDEDLRACLDRSVGVLLEYAVVAAQKINPTWNTVQRLPDSFRRFLSRPSGGSACKRWHLLMRWMVRRRQPDLGLWKLPPSKLLMPIDVHVHRLSGLLGLLTRSAVDDKAVVQLTQALRVLRPRDPVGFDFALSHLGISGHCLGRYDKKVCPTCPLYSVCIHPNQ